MRERVLLLLLLVLLVGGLGGLWLSLLPQVAPPRPWRPRPAPSEEAPADAPLPASYTVELDGAAGAARRRTVAVELAPIVGRAQRVEVVYDLDAVTRPATLEGLRKQADWVSGVRLLLGEVGAWRLRTSRWGLLEGVGILETVYNRLDPDLTNPLRKRGVKDWPGCGQGGSVATCIDPGQYLGMDSDRALRPREAVPDEAELLAGLDRAVAAWFVFEEALLGEITAGATSFVHLCGGAAYGQAQDGCADPMRGPIVFRGPSVWMPGQGRYALSALAAVDFEAGPAPTEARAYVDYLLGSDAAAYGEAAVR
jgi:hypothetical protein